MARRAWRVATLVAALLVSGLPAARASTGTDAAELVRRINAERTSRGMGAYSVASDLAAVARRHAARMASRNGVYHNPNLRYEVTGWRYVGENVASGPTIADIHNGMMRSASHRANILDRDYREVGVGVAYGKTAIFVSQVFVLRKGAARPVTPAPRLRRAILRRTTAPVAIKRAAPVAAPPPMRTVEILLDLVALDPPRSQVPAGSPARLAPSSPGLTAT